MYILFIVTSFWAYGELTIAVEFAERIKAKGFMPYFLIPPTHKKIMNTKGFLYTSLFPKSRAINKIILADIEERYKPEFIILSDFLNYNFCETHYGLTNDDLKVFSGSMGTFDIYNFERTGNYMDTYGFKASKFGELSVNNYDFTLCPCPIISPKDNENKNKFYYRLTNNTLSYDPDKTNLWKKELRLPPDRKMILITCAVWQETYKQYEDVVSFVEVSNQIFQYYINKLSEKYTIVLIGSKEKSMRKKSIFYLEQLLPEEFDKYLLAADIFISRNYISTSLVRAVLSGIPAINFINSIKFHDKKEIDIDKFPFKLTKYSESCINKLNRCYPFRMFPVGWYYFLNPLVKGNLYADLVLQLEQFNTIDSLEKIMDLLENTELQKEYRRKVKAYNIILNDLKEPEEIVKELLILNQTVNKEQLSFKKQLKCT